MLCNEIHGRLDFVGRVVGSTFFCWPWPQYASVLVASPGLYGGVGFITECESVGGKICREPWFPWFSPLKGFV